MVHISVQFDASHNAEYENIGQAITRVANDGGQWVIDQVLSALDAMASLIGLWGSNPSRAFGDLGGSTNPFGDIANFGYKKIRLGLNY